jgi:Domain of unknown function (DUF4375)
MARKSKIPWLDYEGQNTAEILACRATHRVDSLLCALEQALLLRQERNPSTAITPEEQSLLAIMALQREVNNGGYHQFFVNSSCEYALMVVPALQSVSCDATAALTQKALDALRVHPLAVQAIATSILKPNSKRDQALDALDQQFYGTFEIEPKLFAFVESRPRASAIEKMHVAPRPPKRGNPNLIKLGVGLDFAPKTARTFEAVRKLAAEVAIQKEVEATDLELDGAAYLFLFKSFLRDGDLEQCEMFVQRAFDLTREDTGHCVTQREWVEKLIERSDFARADMVTLQYLENLRGDDTSIDFVKNRIKFWADPLRGNGAALPKSREYFRANFPEISLSEPPAPKFHL